MKYYIAKNGKPDGPYEKDGLLEAGLGKDMLVWREGIPAWVRAGDFDEIKDLFPVTPPPIPVMPPPIPVTPPPHPVTPPPHPVTPPPHPATVATPKPAPTPAPAPAPAAVIPTKATQWRAIINGTATEPRGKCRLMRDGLVPNTQVLGPGMTEWREAATVPELKAIFDNVPMPGTESFHTKYLVSIMGNGGFNSTNGFLHIFEDYICIVPSSAMSVLTANFSKTGYVRQFYGIDEIVGLKKGFMARKYIVLSDGTKVLIGAYAKVFNALREAHRRYYTSRGLVEPKLED